MKRWVLALNDDQYKWIKEMSIELGRKKGSGSIIVREAIEAARKSKDFRDGLVDARKKQQLDMLSSKRIEIERLEAEIKRQLKGSPVMA